MVKLKLFTLLSSSKPPYVPGNATPGQHPNVSQDIAPSAVFLALYIAVGVYHQVIFQRNRRRGHKFLMSWAMFGFSAARIGTLVLRIAWATRPNNGSVALSATIFAFLGVLILYFVIMIMTVRIFRARQPKLGWNPWLRQGLRITYGFIVIVILVVIPFGVASGYFKPTTEISRICVWVTKAGVLIFFLFTMIPFALYLLAVFLPPPTDCLPENFGTGSMQSKLIITGVCMFFTIFISGFRFGVTWAPFRPLSKPAWYDSRAAFYVIELGFELIIAYTLLFVRFDRRFWVPNGSTKPGDYSRRNLNSGAHKSSELEQHELEENHRDETQDS